MDDAPYFNEDDNIIVFPSITFPHHYKVQAWLNGTDRNADFVIVLHQRVTERKHSQTVSGLQPTTNRVMFYWKLHGFEKLQQEILDFKEE
jgi:hypothetical protein